MGRGITSFGIRGRRSDVIYDRSISRRKRAPLDMSRDREAPHGSATALIRCLCAIKDGTVTFPLDQSKIAQTGVSPNGNVEVRKVLLQLALVDQNGNPTALSERPRTTRRDGPSSLNISVTSTARY